MKKLFQEPTTLLALQQFRDNLQLISKEYLPEPNFIPHLDAIVSVIKNNGAQIDDLCQTNIEWIGNNVLSAMVDFKPNDRNSTSILPEVFSILMRFVSELELSIPGELSMELRAAQYFVDENIEKFSGQARKQLIFARYLMPVAVLKKLAHHENIAEIRNYNQTYSQAESLNKQLLLEIDERLKKAEELKSRLSHYTAEFNFVGLAQAFMDLLKKKTKENKFTLISLLLLGALATIPPITQILLLSSHTIDPEKSKNLLLFMTPAVITLEIIIIYFFRVVLSQFKSNNTQILQLQLRSALCQFIQSYADYSSEIKKKDSASLEKFENLIFSGIISNDEKLPSTFDGLENIAKVIQSMKSK